MVRLCSSQIASSSLLGSLALHLSCLAVPSRRQLDYHCKYFHSEILLAPRLLINILSPPVSLENLIQTIHKPWVYVTGVLSLPLQPRQSRRHIRLVRIEIEHTMDADSMDSLQVNSPLLKELKEVHPQATAEHQREAATLLHLLPKANNNNRDRKADM